VADVFISMELLVNVQTTRALLEEVMADAFGTPRMVTVSAANAPAVQLRALGLTDADLGHRGRDCR
jgi:hypothetical protein